MQLKINVDKTNGSALPFRHLLETGKDGNRARSYTDFLCPASKGVLGVYGNIKNTVRSSLTVSKLPALRLSSVFENLRRYTMQDTSQALYANVHPHDIISRAKDKLELFNSLLCSSESDGGVNLSHPIIANGIYYLLDGIACELSFALSKMEAQA